MSGGLNGNKSGHEPPFGADNRSSEGVLCAWKGASLFDCPPEIALDEDLKDIWERVKKVGVRTSSVFSQTERELPLVWRRR
jgi:hypothetical protein